MGYNVGLPIMRCSLHPSSTRYKAKDRAAKTCLVAKAWNEMNDEREGRDADIDHSKTQMNVWMVGSTNDNVEKIIQDEINRINSIRRENGARSLRKDTVSCIELIEKVPYEQMRSLSKEQQIELLNTSHKVIEDILKEYRPGWKIIESVQHFDEKSPHNHTLIIPTTTETRWVDNNGKLVDAKGKNINIAECKQITLPIFNVKKEGRIDFYNLVNTEYPHRMREYGYDVDDCKMYDRNMSAEEKKERIEQKKEHGLDSLEYKTKKKEELTKQIEKLKSEQQSISEKLADANQKLDQISADQDTVEKNLMDSQAIKEELQTQKNNLESEKEKTKKQRDAYVAATSQLIKVTESPSLKKYADVVQENMQLRSDITLKDKLINHLQEENAKLKAAVQQWKETAEQWKQTVISIAEKAGKRLMTAFGFDISKTHLSDYPKADISSAIYKMKSEIDEIDPKSLAAIPDSDRKGKYRLAARDENGHYKTVKSGFATRDDAIAYRQNYKSAAKALHSKQLDHSHSREAKM